jgi:hypothetical protein
VLNTDAPSGASPEEAGSPFECLNCPAGVPVRYLVMPRTELHRIVGYPPFKPGVDVLNDGNIMVRFPQDPSGGAEAIYEFSPTFDLSRGSLSDLYWDWHRRLESQGTVKHTAARCPDRAGLIVKDWEPSRGWRTLTAPLSANAERR